MRTSVSKETRQLLAVGAAIVAALGLFWLTCIHFTEAYQMGIRWNRFTGELSCDNAAGFHLSAPWIAVSRIDTRPMRVGVTTAGRGFSYKLVQFQPGAWREFVATEGFRYWWFANRFSYNSGYAEEYRGMRDILRGYAYGAKQYPFVKVLRDFREGE